MSRSLFMTRVLPLLFASYYVLVGCSDSSETTSAGTGDQKAFETVSDEDLSVEESLRQFDFWHGSWDVSNSHFKDGKWVHTGDAKSRVKSVAGGNGIVDQWTGVANGNNIRGCTFRTYDKTVKKWVVVENWPSGRPTEVGIMEGRFKDGNADFFPPNSKNFRYRFNKVTPTSCQWATASLQDNGTYKPTWTMKFSRTGGPTNMNASNTEPVMPLKHIAEKYPEWRSFDSILGKWSGSATRVKDDGTEKGSVAFVGTTLVEGLGMMSFIDIEWEGGEKAEHAWMIHHSARRDNWMVLRLDSSDPEFYSAFGGFDGSNGEFIERDADRKQNVKLDWSVDASSMTIKRFASEDDGQTWSEKLSVLLSRDR